MGVILLHILQWILRIILFLLLLLLSLIIIVMIVPIRYRAEGELLETKPKVKGKISWFFYLLYMSFAYEEDFSIQVKVLGLKIFDTQKKRNEKVNETEESTEHTMDMQTEETEEDIFESVSSKESDKCISEKKLSDESISVQHKTNENEHFDNSSESGINIEETSAENIESIDKADKTSLQQLEERQRIESEKNTQKTEKNKKQKKSFGDKINNIKLKIQEIVQKIKDIISKIQAGKLKVEHYLELWNRKATQITFQRAKKKLGKMITAVLPRKWKLTGEIGFDNPCTTGQFMGVLGAMYPLFGSKVQITPNFEQKNMNIQGEVKGHIRLGNLVYQLISLLLNRHCFKFIKMIFDELGGSQKSEKEI